MDKLRKHRAVVERQAGNDLVSTVGGMQAGYAESVTRATLIDGTFHLAALKHERRCPDPRMLVFFSMDSEHMQLIDCSDIQMLRSLKGRGFRVLEVLFLNTDVEFPPGTEVTADMFQQDRLSFFGPKRDMKKIMSALEGHIQELHGWVPFPRLE